MAGLSDRGTDRQGEEAEARLHPDAESLVRAVDIIDLHMPLYPSTEHFFDDAMFAKMKRGAYLVNTARGKLIERDAVVRALTSGHPAGYAGDVWLPQPAPADHPWRTMPFNGMTPHISGSTPYFGGTPIREEYLIVDGGRLAGTGAESYELS